MKIDGVSYRTIWPARQGQAVDIIDQTLLPHELVIARLETVEDAARAICAMQVRGAPLIGATAAYGMWLAALADPSDGALDAAHDRLLETRPTAVNLAWALEQMRSALRNLPHESRAGVALSRANEIADDDVAVCEAIGEHGVALIRAAVEKKSSGRVNVLTHCNAGWLATVDWGTALAPVYKAHEAGIDIHVWVDETRPRNQGAALTAFELGHHGVAHTIIADNAGGHLMQRGQVDLVIVGTDRTAANGDVANKIGTYLKALAACDNGVPFYVALPGSSIDWVAASGADIPIEERSAEEVTRMRGRTDAGEMVEIEISAPGSPAANPAFDVTPARLVTGLITERGVCEASEGGLLGLYRERAR